MKEIPVRQDAVADGVMAELADFEEQIREYRAGRLGETKMQKLRLQLGTYAQRQEGVQMQRIKIPAGILTAGQLLRLADAADRYGSGFLHFTTREDVQIYYVKLEEVPALLRFLAEAGITTREACGNTVRNITGCYRAGTSPTEAFDVSPYVEALFRYLVRNKYNQVLGRKFKITFEGCAEDHSAVRVHDIGLVAVARRGGVGGVERRGFRVYLGGGLGSSSMLAHLYTDFLPAEELFNLAAATLRLFDRYGERKTRMRARMKFLIQKMGWETFREALDEERRSVGSIPLTEEHLNQARRFVPPAPDDAAGLPVLDPRTASADFQKWSRDSVIAHKIPGYRGVLVRLKLGDLVTDCARGLADAARRFSAGELRISAGQNMYLPWVRQADLVDLHAALRDFSLADAGAETVTDVTTCPGADTCRLGIASAKGLGSALSDALETALAPYQELARPLKIKISGCPNGCAHHGIANLGFHAAAMSENGRTVPAHLLFIGGASNLDQAAIGRVIGKFPAKNGVRVLEMLLDLFRRERQEPEDFNACMARLGEKRLKEALEPLRAIPSFEEDPSFYDDWGHENERFAIRQGIKGECAGSTVAETIPTMSGATEWLAQGEAYFYHGAFEHAALAAYEAAAAAARVLLYAHLVDPFNSEQALWEFENIFVLSGPPGGVWTGLSSRLEDWKRAEPSESAAREILDEARSFLGYCTELHAERHAVGA